MSEKGLQSAPQTMQEKHSRRRSPLAHLLHALNQPLTGLQCSLELAAAGRRSAEQYQRTLEDGLDLVARMRMLVEALRELAEVQEANTSKRQEFQLDGLLCETVDGLRPVAEAKSIEMRVAQSAPLAVEADGGLHARFFRLLDAALSLAQRESEMEICASRTNAEISLTVSWSPGRLPEHSPFSRPELGLLIAQAEWEHEGARWSQLRRQGKEVCTVHFPDSSQSEIGDS